MECLCTMKSSVKLALKGIHNIFKKNDYTANMITLIQIRSKPGDKLVNLQTVSEKFQ